MHDPLRAFRAAILAALGHAPEEIEPGRMHRFRTGPKAADRAGWCKLFTDCQAGVFGDFRAGVSETWTAIDRAQMPLAERAAQSRQVAQAAAERETEQRQQWARNAERIAALKSRSVAVTDGDPVDLYLRHRLGLAPVPACLRYVARLDYCHDDGELAQHPAMVAPLERDGRTLALHRTYLTRDGRKAAVPTPKKLTPAAGLLAGACIPLAAPRHGTLGIAEGIETALAASLASGVPMVAAYSAGNLAAFRWPAPLRRLSIFGDNDQAGRAAAEKLRARAVGAGLAVGVLIPTEPGADWCDVWGSRRLQESEAA
jgi:phage/plasmid primase-like uncharacterized protein